jgi:hypothetical protein
MTKLREIVFAYRKSQTKYGSTAMRTHQLCAQISPYLPTGWRAITSAMPSPKFPWLQIIWARRQQEGSFIFLNKNAARKILPDTLLNLRRKQCKIGFDYVDTDLRKVATFKPDVHIVSSLAAKRAIERERNYAIQKGNSVNGIIRLLHHNVDSHVLAAPTVPQDQLRSIYFGQPAKTKIPDLLKNNISIFDASTVGLAKNALQQISQFNFHYCISSPANAWQTSSEEVVHRPFTKGFTAAALGASLIVNSDVDDVSELLGEDYPFLVEGHEDADIIAIMARAADAFGGQEWRQALASVADMKQLFQPAALAKSLLEIVKETTD